MRSLRGGWHTCPTTSEIIWALTGMFLAGVGLGIVTAVVTSRWAR